jgi:hypothetical protein
MSQKKTKSSHHVVHHKQSEEGAWWKKYKLAVMIILAVGLASYFYVANVLLQVYISRTSFRISITTEQQ